MLSSTANSPAFELDAIWTIRQAAAAAAEAAAAGSSSSSSASSSSSSSAAAAATPTNYAVRVAAAVARVPVPLQDPTGSTTVDDVQLQSGDRLLLTAQADARENGLWSLATASSGWVGSQRVETPFVGMLVYVSGGTTASGWLFSCVRVTDDAVAFARVVSTPSQPDLYLNKTLEGPETSVSPDAVSLILSGSDPSATGGPYRIRHMAAGTNVSFDVTTDPGVLRLNVTNATSTQTNHTGTALRPSDVLLATGCVTLRSVTLTTDPWCTLPSIAYRTDASRPTEISGEVVASVPAPSLLPANASMAAAFGLMITAWVHVPVALASAQPIALFITRYAAPGRAARAGYFGKLDVASNVTGVQRCPLTLSPASTGGWIRGSDGVFRPAWIVAVTDATSPATTELLKLAFNMSTPFRVVDVDILCMDVVLVSA